MSTLTVTTVQTANGSTDLTLQTGNTSAGRIVFPAGGGTITNFIGNTSTFQGIALTTFDASASAYRGLFIDARNESGAAVANFLGDVNTDGSSAWAWSTQPSGTRTDRRVERMRIDGSGNVTISSNNLNVGSFTRAANGFTFLPGGIKMNWGAVSSTSTTGDITFPSAFTTLYSITVSTVGTVSGTTYFPSIIAAGTTTANVRTANTNARTVYYMAIGV